MFTQSEKQKFIRKACTDFCGRTTILLVPGGRLTSVGSAVLLRSDGGVPFLLTAAHVVEDAGWKPLRLLVPSLDLDVADAGVDASTAPPIAAHGIEKAVDVAAVTLRADLHDTLRPLAAGMEAVAADDDTRPDDVVMLAGFPAFLSFRSPTDARMQLFSTITHITGVTGKDEHGRLKVEWTEAIPHEGTPPFPHINVQAGKTMRLGSPAGISGGAVWRVRGAVAGDMWSPSSHAKLIGVPVSWNQHDTEYAESVSAWGPWLAEIASHLDANH